MYIIGPLVYLREQFPDHDLTFARKNLDETEVVIEDEISLDKQDELESNSVLCLSHEDAIDYLNDPDMAGIWYHDEEE
jgi:hypothetical protein